MLTPEEIAAEIKSNLDFLSSNLHDMPDRQQSIRSVFESSWNRLVEIERDVFQQLSVFRGGFTRPAAESVTGATLQILMALVNKSLVKPDYTGRYHIHELLRQYGSEKLREADELERTRDRHLEFFLKVAEESEPKLAGSDQITWANRLELEHDNLRAALKWSRTKEGTAELGLRMTGSLGYFWQWRGYFCEGREYLSAALSSTEASERTEARAKALYEAGRLAYVQSDFPAAGALLEESLSIYRELGPASRLSLAHALLMLGDTETGVGNYTAAVSVIEEGLGIMRELNESGGSSRAIWKLGWCMLCQGDYEQASQCFAESLPFYRQIGDRDGQSMVLAGLGEVALRQGDYGGATELLEESLVLRREVGDRWGIAASFGTLAWVALRQGDLKRATTLLAESLQLRRELGDRGGTAWCLEKLAEISLTTGQQESAPRGDEDFRRAARLFGAAEALRAPVNSAIDLVDQPEYERQLVVLRAQLDEATFTTVWAEGQAMTLQQAIEYALAVEPGQLGVEKQLLPSGSLHASLRD
jgi:tetratricopeptide (TPR) repeat protein